MNLREEILKNSGITLEEGVLEKGINAIFKNAELKDDIKQRKVMELIIRHIGKNPIRKEMIETYMNARRYGKHTHQEAIEKIEDIEDLNIRDLQSVEKSIADLKDIMKKLF